MCPACSLNDTDPDGDALMAIALSGTTHGTLTVSADGDLIYTPDAGYTGLDSFTYFRRRRDRRVEPCHCDDHDHAVITAGRRSHTGSALDDEALLQQEVADPLAVIALEFDRVFRDGAAGPAAALEDSLQRSLEEQGIPRQPEHDRDGLAVAARLLDAQLRNDPIGHGLLPALAAPAVVRRPPAPQTDPPGTRGIDDSRVRSIRRHGEFYWKGGP